MFSYICFGVSVIILFVAVVFAVKNRTEISKWISCITVGILLSTFFMVLPTEWVKEGKSVISEPIYAVLSSVLYSFKALGGEQDIAQLETIVFNGFIKWAYLIINYISFALAPILASSLILSFVGDTGEKIRYMGSFSKSKCCVFSELNENSLVLAEGIKNKTQKRLIVFCDTKKADKDLISQAKKLEAILLYTSCRNLYLRRRFKGYEFFLLSDNEDKSIELTEAFIAKKDKLTDYNITINTFAQSSININILEHLMDKSSCVVFDKLSDNSLNEADKILSVEPKTKIVFCNTKGSNDTILNSAKQKGYTLFLKPWQKAKLGDEYHNYNITLYKSTDTEKFDKVGIKIHKNRFSAKWVNDPFRVRFIDETALFCNNLIFEHPLYDLPDGRKDISVMLIGAGQLAIRMLKTVVWCGQIDGYTLKVNVYDNKAKKVEQEFYGQCPELYGYPIKFIDADVENFDFEEKMKDSLDATFVLIATGLDDLNLQTAEKLFRIFRKHNSYGYTPPIFTRIRKSLKSDNYDKKGSYLSNRNIYLFGTNSCVFAENTLFNSELENLAFAMHLSYFGALDAKYDSFEYKSARNDFYTHEYNRRSSMAAALHICAKLHSCSVINNKQAATSGILPTEKELAAFEKLITDQKLKERLMANEHERWNAFLRSEGYRTAAFCEMEKYMGSTRSHKDDISKSHPCLVSWEELDVLQEQYVKLANEYNIEPTDFKSSDEKLVRQIPQIIRKAKELCKEN